MPQQNIIQMSDHEHLRKKTSKTVYRKTESQKKDSSHKLLLLASGMPDFEEMEDAYHWYCTEYCFGQGGEIRDIRTERRLKMSNTAL